MKKGMLTVVSMCLLLVLGFSLCGCAGQKESTPETKHTEEKSSTGQTQGDATEEKSSTGQTQGDATEDKEGQDKENSAKETSQEQSSADAPQIHPFANENYIYVRKKRDILQISKKTGDIRVFAGKLEKWSRLSYVTEEAIYYVYEKKKEDILCRIPLVKIANEISGEMEEPDFANKEEILKETGFIWDTYVTADYILYHFYDEYETLQRGVSETAIKYDRKSREKKYFDLESASYDITYVDENHLIFGCENLGDGYYYLDLDKDEMTHFAADYYDITSKYMNGSAAANGLFYYCVNDHEEVMAYDLSAGTESSFVAKKEIEAICKDVIAEVGEGWKYNGYDLDGLFYYDGKLYVQAQLHWKRGKYYYMNYIMMSVDIRKADGKLAYDREITGLMQRDVDEDDEEEAVKWWRYAEGWEDEYNLGRFITIVDDTAVLVLDDYQPQLANYDMKTGKLQKVSKKGAGYYLAYSDSVEPYGYGDFQLEDFMDEDYDD